MNRPVLGWARAAFVSSMLAASACATSQMEAPAMVAAAKADPAAAQGHFGDVWQVQGTVIRQGTMSPYAGLRRSELGLESSWLQLESMQQTPLYAILAEDEPALPASLEGRGKAILTCKAYRGGERAGGVVLYPCETVSLKPGVYTDDRITEPPKEVLEHFLRTELGGLSEGYRNHRKATRRRRGLRIGLPLSLAGAVGLVAVLVASGRYDVIN